MSCSNNSKINAPIVKTINDEYESPEIKQYMMRLGGEAATIQLQLKMTNDILKFCSADQEGKDKIKKHASELEAKLKMVKH